jgi:hypothetical protein
MGHPQNLTLGGRAVQTWLDTNGHSQQWLVDEVNRQREHRGIPERIGRSTLWRWMTGKTLINVNDAMLLQIVMGVEISIWSQHSANEPIELLKTRARRRSAA